MKTEYVARKLRDNDLVQDAYLALLAAGAVAIAGVMPFGSAFAVSLAIRWSVATRPAERKGGE